MKNYKKLTPLLFSFFALYCHYTLPSAGGASAAQAAGAGQGMSAAQAAGALRMFGEHAPMAQPAAGAGQATLAAQAAALPINAQVPNEPWSFKTQKSPSSASFSPSGKLLAVVNNGSHTVNMFSAKDKTGVLTPAKQPWFAVGESPTAGRFSPNGRWFANTNIISGTVSVFAVDEAMEKFTPVPDSPFAVGNDSRPYSASFSPDNTLLAVGATKIIVFTVNQETGTLACTYTSPFNAGTSLAFSPKGNWLASANYSNNSLTVFKLNEEKRLVPIPGSPFKTGKYSYAVAYSPDGALLVSSNATKPAITVFTVNETTGKLTLTQGSCDTEEGGSYGASLSFSPDSRWLANANNHDHTITVFAVDSKRGKLNPIQSLPLISRGTSCHVAYSPVGLLLAVTNISNDTVWMYEVNQEIGTLTRIAGDGLAKHKYEESRKFLTDNKLITASDVLSILYEYVIAPKRNNTHKMQRERAQQAKKEQEALQAQVALDQKLKRECTTKTKDLFEAIQDCDHKKVTESVNPETVIVRPMEAGVNAQGKAMHVGMRTPLMEAIVRSEQRYTDYDAIFNTLLNFKGETLLEGNIKVVRESDLNARDLNFNTPLMLALKMKRFDYALKIAQKMDANEQWHKAFTMKDKDGQTVDALLEAEIVKVDANDSAQATTMAQLQSIILKHKK